MTYTKGEWTVEHEFNVFSDNRLVAACGGYADNWKTEEVHNENVSNARLIAAAPDYHKLVSDIIDNTLFSNEPPSKTEWNKWRKRAVEIHNKAEGK